MAFISRFTLIANVLIHLKAEDVRLDYRDGEIFDSYDKQQLFRKLNSNSMLDSQEKTRQSCDSDFSEKSDTKKFKSHKRNICKIKHIEYFYEPSNDNCMRFYRLIDNPKNIEIQTSLDKAQKIADGDVAEGIRRFECIYSAHSVTSALFSIGKLSNKLAMKLLEEVEKTNNDDIQKTILTKNIQKWQRKSANSMCKILKTENVPKFLSLQAATFCLEIATKVKNENQVFQALSFLHERYPSKTNYGYQLGLRFLLRLDLDNCEVTLWAIVDRIGEKSKTSKERCLLGLCLKLKNKIKESNDAEDEEAINNMIDFAIDSEEEDLLRLFNFIGTTFNRHGKHAEAEIIFDEGVRIGLFLSKWQRSSSKKDFRLKSLTGRPIWEPKQTGYEKELGMLQNHYKVIRSEGLRALFGDDRNYKEESENLREEGLWQQLVLFETGIRSKKGCKLAPKTCQLIMKYMKEISAECKHGQIKFSVIHPGTHIWPHSGPSNCRLRAHLGLVVPEVADNERLEIRIADQYAHWNEGKYLIIDDSFEHEIWYQKKNGGARLVLLIDMWHPDLSKDQKENLKPLINRNQNHSTIFTVSGIVNRISDDGYYNINDSVHP